jgi:hypothetical protein
MSERVIEERPGFAGVLRAWGVSRSATASPGRCRAWGVSRSATASPGRCRAVGGVGGHIGAPHVE